MVAPSPSLAKTKAKARLRLWRNDPVCWFRDVLGVDLEGGPWAEKGQRAYQAEILRAIVENREVYIPTGNSVGKDYLSGRIVMWWIHTRRGKALTTAVKEDQIKKILWSELRTAHAAAKVELPGKLMPSECYWEVAPNWFAQGIVGKDENAIHGKHSANTLIIGDESAGLPEWMPAAVYGMAVGAKDRIVWLGNPLCGPEHFFFRGSQSPDVPGKKKTVRVAGTDTPNVVQGREVIPGLQTVEGIEIIVRQFGPKHQVTRARVDGVFPTRGSNSVIGYEHINPAKLRHAEGVKAKATDACRGGGDVARFGDDSTAFAWTKGPEFGMSEGDVRADLSQPEVEAFYGRRCEEIGACSIAIDGGAMGAGPIDYLRQNKAIYRLHRSFAVHEVLFGAKAYDEERFADKRTELWWLMREFLQDVGAGEIDQDLEDELLAPTYSFVNRRIKMEPKDKTKERLGRSPDRADALAIAIAGHIGTPTSLVLSGAGSSDEAQSEWDKEDSEPSSGFDGMGMGDRALS